MGLVAEKLKRFNDSNSNKRLNTVRWTIENLMTEQEEYYKAELNKTQIENDKIIGKQKTEIQVLNDNIRSLKDYKIIADARNEELLNRIEELNRHLERFLPPVKSVERYCTHCNSTQKFTTNN